jgi:hypothetical protein
LKFGAAALLSIALAAGPAAQAAPGDDAKEILKKMTDYVGAQQTISATVDTDVEVLTTELEKIIFASSGQVLMNRPDKLRVSRIGGYADVEMVFDGKTFSVLGKHLNSYAQMDAPGTIDELVERLRAGSGGAVPGADLLLMRAYEEMTADVIEAKHIGRGVIGGIECEHLAFRTPEVDWQLWVEVGPNPIPRKYVIISKTIAEAPEYTLLIKDWRTEAPADANAFEFRPPEGATKVATDSLQNIDEIPPGIVAQGRR